MNVLEKILKEMDIEVQKQRELCGGLENTPGYKLYEKAASMFKRIVMEHMGDVENTKDNWIPVNERLPENGIYLCTLDGELVGETESFTGMCGIENGKWDEEGCVIAWKPIPEPYKGE